MAMDLGMVPSAYWHGELIADFAGQCPALGEGDPIAAGRK
jgi:hypothetical protein